MTDSVPSSNAPRPNPRPNGSAHTQKLSLTDRDWHRYVRRAVEQAPPGELRLDDRHQRIVQCVMRVTLKEGSQIFLVHSRDISRGGMGFQHHEPLPVGADCTVVLETNRGQAQMVSGRIRWTREIGGGLFTMGLVFDQSVNLEDFIDLTGSSSEAGAA
ncbi:MAG: PilZ domain-containing protein [Phycisphaeraceae bacterium]|nr:PilZ domain-containing protein [Phycisphaeraceae bacterium]